MCLRELSVRIEGLFLDRSREDVLVLGPYESRALTRLDVLEIDDYVRVAVNFECDAFSEISCINHNVLAFLVLYDNCCDD